jgi:N-acetyl-anhydromuramyl-L-alanine amidase AmpD
MIIPFAQQYKFGEMKTLGDYTGGNGPLGLVVHFTAGRWENGLQSAKDSIVWGIKSGYAFLDIAHTGELIQAHDVMKWGYHAGESAWQLKLGKVMKKFSGVSDELIGVEMNNPGKLEFKNGKFISWFDQEIPENLVRHVAENETFIGVNGRQFKWDCPTGYYMKYTPEQELTLAKTILWLYGNIMPFKLENVVGHHEVSGLHGIGRWRKNDPGGALSMPMEAFRAHLIANKLDLKNEYGIEWKY